MEIWAHRGCSYRYPENTISSFRAACEYEITGIEFDVQLSRDGELVVIHDEKVDRTTNGTGNVCDMTLDELKQLRMIPNEDTGLLYETIPTLREVLSVLAPECREKGILLNIELKNSVVRYEGMEQKLLAVIHEFGLERFVIYSSFNPESICLLKQLEPEVKTGILAASLKHCLEINREIEADALHPYIHQLDIPDIRQHTALPIRVWNVMKNEPFFPEESAIEKYNLEELEQEGITDIFTNCPEHYVKKRLYRTEPNMIFTAGKCINEENGFVEAADAESFATLLFSKAEAGSRLHWKSTEYGYQIYIYTLETEERLIYTYCYQEEENWASYCREKSVFTFSLEDYSFDESCYFRLVVQPVEDSPRGGLPGTSELLEFFSPRERAYVSPSYFQAELMLTAEKVKDIRKTDDLVFILLSDSHYVNNGTWEDTAYNILELSGQVGPDAVIHLGDLTDGMLPIALTKEYAGRVLHSLKQTGAPVYVCLGNHDSNYFRNNPEKMTETEMSGFYLEREKPYYYVDYPRQKLRVLFLYSFDYREKVRYGFPKEEVEWVESTLAQTEAGWSVLVFSHVPPLPEIHYWSDEIRNGEELMRVLEAYHAGEGHTVLGYIHGHNHAEQIYTERAFPIVSVGCNKLEDFKDKKPGGSLTFDRKRHTVTQDLWDVLVVSGDKQRMSFIRFGAGEDRIVEC